MPPKLKTSGALLPPKDTTLQHPSFPLFKCKLITPFPFRLLQTHARTHHRKQSLPLYVYIYIYIFSEKHTCNVTYLTPKLLSNKNVVTEFHGRQVLVSCDDPELRSLRIREHHVVTFIPSRSPLLQRQASAAYLPNIKQQLLLLLLLLLLAVDQPHQQQQGFLVVDVVSKQQHQQQEQHQLQQRPHQHQY